jgi:GNAT superfamily N-acetyltransferase
VALRGQDVGSALLEKAEAFARKGVRWVWLDTHGFQAPAFYRKRGYACFVTLNDCPRGRDRFFFRKHLSADG